jgi:hypothetical protein
MPPSWERQPASSLEETTVPIQLWRGGLSATKSNNRLVQVPLTRIYLIQPELSWFRHRFLDSARIFLTRTLIFLIWAFIFHSRHSVIVWHLRNSTNCSDLICAFSPFFNPLKLDLGLSFEKKSSIPAAWYLSDLFKFTPDLIQCRSDLIQFSKDFSVHLRFNSVPLRSDSVGTYPDLIQLFKNLIQKFSDLIQFR